MTMLDDIRRDREQGGGGPGEMWTIANTWIMRGDVHVATIPKAHDGDWSPANARRIARVPQMEAALLAAEELAEAVRRSATHQKDGKPYCPRNPKLYEALAAFRKAMEDTQ